MSFPYAKLVTSRIKLLSFNIFTANIEKKTATNQPKSFFESNKHLPDSKDFDKGFLQKLLF